MPDDTLGWVRYACGGATELGHCPRKADGRMAQLVLPREELLKGSYGIVASSIATSRALTACGRAVQLVCTSGTQCR